MSYGINLDHFFVPYFFCTSS